MKELNKYGLPERFAVMRSPGSEYKLILSQTTEPPSNHCKDFWKAIPELNVFNVFSEIVILLQ